MSEALLKKAARPLIVAATLIWGSTFFIMKDTLDDVDLMFLLAFRLPLRQSCWRWCSGGGGRGLIPPTGGGAA